MSVTGILVQEVVVRLTNIAVVGITEDKAWASIVMVANCSEIWSVTSYTMCI